MKKHVPEQRERSEFGNDQAPVLGLPPLRMVLTGGEQDQAGKSTATRGASAGTRLVESTGVSDELDNERVVRRIIEHLLKEA